MAKVNIILVAAVLIVAVLLSMLRPSVMEGLQADFLSLLSPFLHGGAAVKKQFGSVGQGLKTLDQLEEENTQLVTENKRLLALNQTLGDLGAENKKLRDALGYEQRSAFNLVPARIISRDASTWWNTVKINRGFADGLERDQPVITDQGLVGKVTTVAKNDSLVLLATDENCRVAVRVEGTREQGILSGERLGDVNGNGEMQLNYLTKTANLQPGQHVYSAGVSGGVFPSGIMAGTVKSFQTRALDGHATVLPAVDLSTVEDVFVVVGAK